MKEKRVLSLLLAVLLVCTFLIGCGGKASEAPAASSDASVEPKESSAKNSAPIELSLGMTNSGTSSWMVAAETFKELVEEQTNGKYHISIYPNDQLAAGDMVKGWEMLFSGVSDIDLRSVMIMASIDERMTALCMPWLFKEGYKSVDEYLYNGPGGEAIMDIVREKGAVPLALAENGFRQVMNNKKPITSPADFKDMKVRIPATPMFIDLYKMLGADPTSLSWSEVFTAMQQGTIDAMENSNDSIYSAKLHEVAKYMTVMNYSYDAVVLSLSQRVWDSLTPEDQAIFAQAAKDACAKQVQAAREADASIVKQIEEAGVQVNYLTDEQIAAFQEAVAPIYEQYKDVIGEELLNKLGYTFD